MKNVTDCQTLVGNQPLTVKLNHLLNGQNPIPVWGPEFEVKLDVKINSWHGYSARGSIFCFTSFDGQNVYKVGHMIPSMYELDQMIHLFTDIDIYPMWDFVNQLGQFQLGKWYTFTMSQKKDRVKLLSIIKYKSIYYY